MFDFVQNFIDRLVQAAQAFVQSVWDAIPDKTNAVTNAIAVIEGSGIWAWVLYTLSLINYIVPVELMVALAMVPVVARFTLVSIRTVAWAWERLPFN